MQQQQQKKTTTETLDVMGKGTLSFCARGDELPLNVSRGKAEANSRLTLNYSDLSKRFFDEMTLRYRAEITAGAVIIALASFKKILI